LKQSQEILQNIPQKSEAPQSDLSLLKNPSADPDIPFVLDKAFLQLRKDSEGKIAPSYQWRECKKRFIWCLEWQTKRVFFYDLEYFYANGWGLSKRRTP
jgi:hypothetical protein